MKLCDEDRAALDGHVTAWLYTVCRRRAIDIRRKESHMQTASDVLPEARVDPGPRPESVVTGREEAGRVDRLLAGLPDNQQEVVRLKFGGGLSYKEIAGVTGLSVGNVGFLLHTAIATLRRHLGDT